MEGDPAMTINMERVFTLLNKVLPINMSRPLSLESISWSKRNARRIIDYVVANYDRVDPWYISGVDAPSPEKLRTLLTDWFNYWGEEIQI